MICTAQNLQQTRQLSAIAWWAVMCPSELLTHSMTVIHRHTEKTKGKSGHKYGSPHVQAWAQFVQTMLAAAKKMAIPDSDVKPLQDHLDAMQKAGPEMGHHWTRQCRIKKLKDEKTMMLFYGISSLQSPADAHACEIVLHALIKKLGCDVKPGTSPPSLVEKKLQLDIDNLKKELGLEKKK